MSRNHTQNDAPHTMARGHYSRFWLTLAISFVLMYAIMFLNVSQSDHVYLSLNRAYLAALMVLSMAVLMILMMRAMLPNPKKNLAIVSVATVLFFTVIYLLRSQSPIGDVQYMKAMIPHHSSAILNSKEAGLHDPEVQKLAKEIIESQEREITEMKLHISRLQSQ